MRLEYPIGLADTAAQFGVKLDSGFTIDPRVALVELDEQINAQPQSVFGGLSLGSLNPIKLIDRAMGGGASKVAIKAGIDPNKAKYSVNVKKTVKGLTKGVGTGVAVASFAIPGVGPIVGGAGVAALAAADKVLADPNVKNAAKVIKNTQALAALGDEASKRGAAVLQVQAKIRTALGAIPGMPAIPVQTPAQKAAVQATVNKAVKVTSAKQVKNLAAQRVNAPATFPLAAAIPKAPKIIQNRGTLSHNVTEKKITVVIPWYEPILRIIGLTSLKKG